MRQAGSLSHVTTVLFSEILGVDGFLNLEILDVKKRIGDVYPTCPNTLSSLGQFSTTKQ